MIDIRKAALKSCIVLFLVAAESSNIICWPHCKDCWADAQPATSQSWHPNSGTQFLLLQIILAKKAGMLKIRFEALESWWDFAKSYLSFENITLHLQCCRYWRLVMSLKMQLSIGWIQLLECYLSCPQRRVLLQAMSMSVFVILFILLLYSGFDSFSID